MTSRVNALSLSLDVVIIEPPLLSCFGGNWHRATGGDSSIACGNAAAAAADNDEDNDDDDDDDDDDDYNLAGMTYLHHAITEYILISDFYLVTSVHISICVYNSLCARGLLVASSCAMILNMKQRM